MQNTTHASKMIGGGSIALIGHPNVGKSVLFQKLTGQLVTVSNYPGTTLEVMRGKARQLPETEVIDTPGVIAFPPYTEDEQVTARLLLNEPLKGILQVGDAKNLRRTLLLTVQLAEMGIPLVLALNMMDEARARGVIQDHERLAENLHIPVIPTTAIRGQGIGELVNALVETEPSILHVGYPVEIETALSSIEMSLNQALSSNGRSTKLNISARALGLLWLSEDATSEEWLHEHLSPSIYEELITTRAALAKVLNAPAASIIQGTRLEYVDLIAKLTTVKPGTPGGGIPAQLARLTTHPVWGMLILGIVLYAIYWFVGVFGAGFLVDLLEGQLFGEIINPWVVERVNQMFSSPFLVDLLVGEFGLWTIGLTYALALILPIVTTFFLAFGVLEDSGYLPRLAALSNRFFQMIGLNGKAVLPMVLGLGCVTMATLTTRVLESKRDRLLTTLFLALAIPCSAQLGVVMGMLAGISFAATLIWGAAVLLVLLAVGWLASRLMPGDRTPLLVELPPLRWPAFSNVITKTIARLEWYLKEVIPLFLLGALVMFALSETGLLDWMIQVAQPLVTGWLGLPAEASTAFLMGFLRRDFGATGLFVMESQGLLTSLQIVVAMITITLFIPCIASVMMIAKEHGWKLAAGILVIVTPLAFLVGGLFYRLLAVVQWGL